MSTLRTIRYFCVLFCATLFLNPMGYASQSSPAYECGKAPSSFRADATELLHTVLLTVQCRADVNASVEMRRTPLKSTPEPLIQSALTVAVLPVTVWRLNHWFDWVRAVSQGPGKAAPPSKTGHYQKPNQAGSAAHQRSWRPAQAQQRRSVMASARSRSLT